VSRRGSAILAVFLLMVIGIVIAATVLATADAAGASSQAELQRTQSRALAWSGVQALMSELAEQREDLLDGQAPRITAEWDLYTLDDGTRGVVRLVDLDPGSPAVITPENAKLDINTATAEMLALVPGLDAAIAGRIVEARGVSPFTSVGQLLQVEGVTPAILFGAGEDAGGEPAPGAEPDPLVLPEVPGSAGGLGRLLTVFSFDPNVQVGIEGGSDFRGNLRVNLDQSWSEELGRAIADRFDQGTADIVKGLMESGRTFGADSELVRVLVDNGVGAEAWPEILDVFTTSDDQFLRGRVDLNTAPAEVLACIPGIASERAAAIVDAREGIDPLMRRSPSWVVAEGLLTPEEFVLAADWVTTRSSQWRVRLEAGIEPGDPLSGFDESAPMTLDQMLESWDEPPGGAMEHRVTLEAVIDVASTRPRVAYLREVTLLEPVLAMHRASHEADAEGALSEPADGIVLEPEPEPEPESDATRLPVRFFDDDPFLTDSVHPESGMNDFGLDFDDHRGADAPHDDEPEGGDGAMDPTGEPRDPPAMVDRRIGRWTTRKAGGT